MTLTLEAFLKSIADELAAGDRQMAVRFSASLKTWLETTNIAELAHLPQPTRTGTEVADTLAAALVKLVCLHRRVAVPGFKRSNEWYRVTA